MYQMCPGPFRNFGNIHRDVLSFQKVSQPWYPVSIYSNRFEIGATATPANYLGDKEKPPDPVNIDLCVVTRQYLNF